MNLEGFRKHCLAKKGVTEEFPFGEETLVYKVMGKMFALTDLESFESINLKVDPETGEELREKYSSVLPGYHMNKKHWITVLMDGSIPDKKVLEWVDNSYQLVASALTKSQKSALESM
ncbi:MAG TPA: MmcQ/YjbR family DNA-binding protein [Chryseosolibacter sp.]